MKQIRLLFLMAVCLILTVQIHAQIDTFATLIGAPVNTTGWNMVGQAKIAKVKYTDSSEVLLCPTNTTFTSGGIFYNQPINLAKCSRWVADFDFRIFDGNAADGLTFCFLDKPPAGFVIGQGLGIPQNSSGLKVCFDTWNNCQCNGGYQVPKLEIRWGLGYSIQNSSGSGLTCWDSTKTGNGECNAVGYPTIYNTGGILNFIRSANYNHATIKYDRGTVSVYLNGTLFSSVTIPVAQQPLFTGYLGFTSATGSNYDNHSIRNVIIKSDIPPSYAGPAQTICHAKTASLGAAGDTTFKYTWLPTTGLSSATIANPTVTLTNNTLAPITQKYFISTAYDSATTCITVDSVIVTVNPYPHLNNILGNKNICFNKTSQLTNDSTGGTWLTNNPLIASITNAGLASGNIVDTTTVKYIVANNYGCTDSVSALLNVRPTPLIDTIAGLSAVCATHGITLTNDTLGGVWASLNTTIATIGSSTGILNGLSAGKDTIRYTVTSAYACVDSVSRVLTINPLPPINSIGGTNTLCFGKTTQLTNTTFGGTWISTNPTIASIDNSGKVTGNAAGTATIRYIVVNGFGCSDSVATNVTVNSLPVIAAIGGTPAVCIGKYTQLTETTPGGTWVSANTGIATIDNSGKITTVTAATDTIRYLVTNGNGCTDSVFTIVTVNSLPVINNISGSNSLCIGKTTQLSEITTGGNWSTTNATVASVNNTGLITGNIAGSAIIRYTITNSAGCTDSVSLPITINSLPVIAPIGGTPNACVGKNTQLTEATTGGTWVSTNTGVATVDNSGKITTVSNGTASIHYIVNNGAGCTDSVSTLFTVNSLPVIAPIGGTPNTCIGKNSQLTDATAGGVWVSANPSIATIDNSGKITTVSAGTATIRYIVTNSNGCTDSVSTSVAINSLPVIAPIGGTPSACIGKNTQLTDATPGGVWVSANPSIATIDNSGKITTVSAGTATIRYIVTNGNGCTDSVSTAVTINSLPVIAPIGGTPNACIGKNTQLTDATSGGVWVSANPSIATIDNSGKITTVSAGTATIRYIVTNGNGCNDSVSTAVTINNLPVIAPIGGTPSACLGKNTQLTEVTTGGVWVSVNPSIATIDNSGKITTVSSGTATIRYIVTNGNGCTDSVSTAVTINSLPFIAPIGGAPSACIGKNTQLSEVTPGGVWVSANPSIATIDNSGKITTVSAGTVTIRYIVTNGNGCTDSVSTAVTINSLPVIAPIGGTSSTCLGNNALLTETTSGGVWVSVNPTVATVDNFGKITTVSAGIDTIRYIVTNGNGCTDSVATIFTINKATASTTIKSVCPNVLPYIWNLNSYNATGNYLVHLTNAAGCDSAATLILTVEDFKINLSVSPSSSAVSPLTIGTSVTAQITSTNTISSSIWEPSTLFSNNLNSQTVVVSDSFTIKVVGISPDGCSDTAMKIVYVNPLNDLFIPNAIVPTNTSDIRINHFMIYGTLKSAELTIFNQWGQKIFHSDDAKYSGGKGWDGTYSGQLQPTGVYVYVVKITYLNNKTETKSGSVNLIR